VLLTIQANAQESSSDDPPVLADSDLVEPAPVPIGRSPVSKSEPPDVHWSGVLSHSLRFLALEHGFRLWTEAGTRAGLNQIPRGYLNSLGNLHGWADGDPFYVNYVGHPMQGAVSGFIWTQNDRRYWDVEFGRNRRYWKSRMRAAAFAWVYGIQFEIGPLSEASLGQIQAHYPQQGFVDQVVTPVILDDFGIGGFAKGPVQPVCRALSGYRIGLQGQRSARVNSQRIGILFLSGRRGKSTQYSQALPRQMRLGPSRL